MLWVLGAWAATCDRPVDPATLVAKVDVGH